MTNDLWLMIDEYDWWLMKMTDDNDWWKWLMTMTDDNDWWLMTYD